MLRRKLTYRASSTLPRLRSLLRVQQTCFSTYSLYSTTITTTTPIPLPEPPKPVNASHHDLPTFLAYAKRSSLSPTSSTFVGTHYEYTVKSVLRRHAFSLTRIGGKSDSGIDLLGTWHLPAALTPHPLRVIVQCKKLKAKLGPNLIRELEGAFVGAPSGWRGKGILGVLVSPREATKGVRDAMGRSAWPMVWILLEPATTGAVEELEQGESEAGAGASVKAKGTVRQMLWNRAASEAGLHGLDVTIRYNSAAEEGETTPKECMLMWQGTPVPGLDLDEEKEDEFKTGVDT